MTGPTATPGPSWHLPPDPIYASLTGAHAHLSVHRGRAVRYQREVAPFSALPADAGEADWRDLAVLAGGHEVLMGIPPAGVPCGWRVVASVPTTRMIQVDPNALGDAHVGPPVAPLAPEDAPALLALAAGAGIHHAGPRSLQLGVHLGVWRAGRLVAVAAQRFRLPGWVEISTVCTDPAHRGQGLASRLVMSVAAAIRDGGDTAFLHVGSDNVSAIRVYERLGFVAEPRRAGLCRLVPPALDGTAPELG